MLEDDFCGWLDRENIISKRYQRRSSLSDGGASGSAGKNLPTLHAISRPNLEVRADSTSSPDLKWVGTSPRDQA